MLKNKWFLLYVALSAFFGYISGGGLYAAFIMPFLLPGAMLNLIVSPHGVNNSGLIVGGSLIFWILMYLRFKYFAPSVQPVVTEHRRSIETEVY